MGLTKSQVVKRLNEALSKVDKAYLEQPSGEACFNAKQWLAMRQAIHAALRAAKRG
jgi:hypothetical protein